MRKSGKSVKNETFGEIAAHSIGAAFGLAVFAVGVYLTIQANIGVAPWDCFFLGVQETFGIKYGNVSVCVSLILIVVDLLMRERIGIGTILDAVVVGKTVDLCNALDPVPVQTSLPAGIALMLAGLVLNGLGQYIYMKMGLCCGPRDGLLLGVSKRLKRLPIGAVSILIMAVALFFGWRLGGPVGIGTIIGAFLMGPIMQMVFQIMGFDAKKVEHQDLFTSAGRIAGRGANRRKSA